MTVGEGKGKLRDFQGAVDKGVRIMKTVGTAVISTRLAATFRNGKLLGNISAHAHAHVLTTSFSTRTHAPTHPSNIVFDVQPSGLILAYFTLRGTGIVSHSIPCSRTATRARTLCNTSRERRKWSPKAQSKGGCPPDSEVRIALHQEMRTLHTASRGSWGCAWNRTFTTFDSKSSLSGLTQSRL